MKRLFAALVVAASVAATGCNKGGTEGGPGASNPSNKGGSLGGQAEDTFTLSVPTFSTKLKQGETKNAEIGIKRGTNFDQDVALTFDGVPQGVTIDPVAPLIKHGDSEAKISIKAANDAAVGDFTIKVIGQPSKGKEATNNFKLTVEKK